MCHGTFLPEIKGPDPVLMENCPCLSHEPTGCGQMLLGRKFLMSDGEEKAEACGKSAESGEHGASAHRMGGEALKKARRG